MFDLVAGVHFEELDQVFNIYFASPWVSDLDILSLMLRELLCKCQNTTLVLLKQSGGTHNKMQVDLRLAQRQYYGRGGKIQPFLSSLKS